MIPDLDSRSAPVERSQPLITPVPMDAVFAAAAEWQAGDGRLTASQIALDSAVTRMRQALSAGSIAVDETPGPGSSSVDDAISALDRSRQALTAALNARAKALAALDDARAASDAPLRQAEDILLARRGVAVCVTVLLGLIAFLVLA